MAAETDVTGESLTRGTEDDVSPGQQQLEDVNHKLLTLCEKINSCERVLKDLRDLSDVLARKSLQDVTLSSQK